MVHPLGSVIAGTFVLVASSGLGFAFAGNPLTAQVSPKVQAADVGQQMTAAPQDATQSTVAGQKPTKVQELDGWRRWLRAIGYGVAAATDPYYYDPYYYDPYYDYYGGYYSPYYGGYYDRPYWGDYWRYRGGWRRGGWHRGGWRRGGWHRGGGRRGGWRRGGWHRRHGRDFD